MWKTCKHKDLMQNFCYKGSETQNKFNLLHYIKPTPAYNRVKWNETKFIDHLIIPNDHWWSFVKREDIYEMNAEMTNENVNENISVTLV